MAISLMFHDTPVIKFKDEGGKPVDVAGIPHPELLPPALMKNPSFENIQAWRKARRIPPDRDGLDKIEPVFIKWKHFLTDCEFSFSDPWWFQMQGMKYDRIRPDRGFSELYGNMAFTPWLINYSDRRQIPDLTTNGKQKKCWKKDENGKIRLYKTGKGLEVFAEYALSKVFEKTDVNAVRYDLDILGTELVTICDNFVPADNAIVLLKEFSAAKTEREALKACGNIPDAEKYIHQYFTLYPYFGVTGKDVGNIAFLYDVPNKRFTGPAPFYDFSDAFNDFSARKKLSSKEFADYDFSFLADGKIENFIKMFPTMNPKIKPQVINTFKILSKTVR